MRIEDNLSLQLKFAKGVSTWEVQRQYSDAGKWYWIEYRSGTICDLKPVSGPKSIEVPVEMRSLSPQPVFNFEERLEHDGVMLCSGLSGKPLRPYYLGGSFDEGARFSIPGSIVTITVKAGQHPLISISEFSIEKIVGFGLEVREKVLLKDQESLPHRFDRFALPVELANDYNRGLIHYSPLYFDETDEHIKASYCYRYGTALVKCMNCHEKHEMPLEVLLRDRRMRLKLLRQDGSPSQTLIGEMPAHFCQIGTETEKD